MQMHPYYTQSQWRGGSATDKGEVYSLKVFIRPDKNTWVEGNYVSVNFLCWKKMYIVILLVT